MAGNGKPERINCSVEIIQVYRLNKTTLEQIKRNACAAGKWLNVLPPKQPIATHDFCEEASKPVFASWVAEGSRISPNQGWA